MKKKLWNNWKTIKKGEYLYALVPTHPNATKNGYVLEHRVVLENKLGRLLYEFEDGHHIDENKHNNSPENLEVKLKGDHQRLHKLKYPDGHFVNLVCSNCKTLFSRDFKNRPEVKGTKLTFCSRKCSGLYYNKN